MSHVARGVGQSIAAGQKQVSVEQQGRAINTLQGSFKFVNVLLPDWNLQGTNLNSETGSESQLILPPPRKISRFSPRIDRIFPWKGLNPIFGAQDEGFSEFRSK